MNYYLFNAPRKPGDKPLKYIRYEPNDFMLEQWAVKYGPVILITEEQYLKDKKKYETKT